MPVAWSGDGDGTIAVQPFGPWATMTLALLSMPVQVVGYMFLRLASERVGDVPAILQDFPEKFALVLGSVLVTVGLFLNCLETVMGVGAHRELDTHVIAWRKVVLLVQLSQVFWCLLLERFILTAAPLPKLMLGVCTSSWIGSFVIVWAAPWPIDDTSKAFVQTDSCGDGFRLLFTFVYMPVWATSLTMGVLSILLMTCLDDAENAAASDFGSEEEYDEDEQTGMLHIAEDERKRKPMRVFRRLLLPIIYGFAMSASGLCFASGWNTKEWKMRCSIGGIFLLVIAVSTIASSLVTLKMSLCVWAPVSQCCQVILRLVQNHLLFEKFRWQAETGFGVIVGKKPGVFFYLFGVGLLLATVMLYLLTYEWKEWIRNQAPQSEHGVDLPPIRRHESGLARAASLGRQFTAGVASIIGSPKGVGLWATWRGMLLVVVFYCYVQGITSPLYNYSVCPPDVQWVNGEEAMVDFQSDLRQSLSAEARQNCIGSTMGFVDSITWLYDHQMPFSAMMAAYRSLIGPPIEFFVIVMLLLSDLLSIGDVTGYNIPSFSFLRTIPEPVKVAMKSWLACGAASKFATNCMVCMLYVTIIQAADPGGNCFEAEFTSGFRWMMAYCVMYGGLVKSMGTSKKHALHYDRDLSVMSQDEEASSEDDEDGWESTRSWLGAILQTFVVTVVVCLALYFSINTAFMVLDMRFKKTTLMQIKPVLWNLWLVLIKTNWAAAGFAAATFAFCLPVRIVLVLLLHTICKPVRASHRSSSSWVSLALPDVLSKLECVCGHFTLCHIWAEAIILLWLGILTRSDADYQVCARLPSPPIGLAAIIALGIGVPSLHQVTAKLSAMWMNQYTAKSWLGGLPGGLWVWCVLPASLFVFWAGFTRWYGPTSALQQEFAKHHFNHLFDKYRPLLNEHLRSAISESKGQCDELWEQYPGKHKDCLGHAPLVRLSTMGWDVVVKWATGLNDIYIEDLKFQAPVWIGANRDVQQWHLTASTVFINLSVWVVAGQGLHQWVNDNVCCQNNFSFSVQAVSNCTPGRGFGDIALSMVSMDHVEMESEVMHFGGPAGTSASLQVDYGDADKVNLRKVIQDFISGRVGGGKLMMRTSEGEPLNVVNFLRNRLQEAVRLNTYPSRECPYLLTESADYSVHQEPLNNPTDVPDPPTPPALTTPTAPMTSNPPEVPPTPPGDISTITPGFDIVPS